MVEAARNYAARRPDPKFTPAPMVWLNGGRWNDDNSKPLAASPASGHAASLARLVESPFGQRKLASMGQEEGMRFLSAHLAKNKGTA